MRWAPASTAARACPLPARGRGSKEPSSAAAAVSGVVAGCTTPSRKRRNLVTPPPFMVLKEVRTMDGGRCDGCKGCATGMLVCNATASNSESISKPCATKRRLRSGSYTYRPTPSAQAAAAGHSDQPIPIWRLRSTAMTRRHKQTLHRRRRTLRLEEPSTDTHGPIECAPYSNFGR